MATQTEKEVCLTCNQIRKLKQTISWSHNWEISSLTISALTENGDG